MLIEPLSAPAGASASRAVASAAAMPHHAVEREQNRADDDSKHAMHQPLPIPAKPMNAIDRHDAATSTSPILRAISGTSATSMRSRMDAKSDSANGRPIPAPSANPMPSTSVYLRLVWKSARPRMAQFVVMSGR